MRLTNGYIATETFKEKTYVTLDLGTTPAVYLRATGPEISRALCRPMITARGYHASRGCREQVAKDENQRALLRAGRVRVVIDDETACLG